MMNACRKKLAGKALKGVERQRMLARHDLLQERRGMRDTLCQIIPYERPKLAAIPPPEDQNNPMRVKPDFSQLTDAELTALEKILLKVGGATAAGPAIGADNAGSPASGRMATSAVSNRAAKNRTDARTFPR
jgi:hypothetical protein